MMPLVLLRSQQQLQQLEDFQRRFREILDPRFVGGEKIDGFLQRYVAIHAQNALEISSIGCDSPGELLVFRNKNRDFALTAPFVNTRVGCIGGEDVAHSSGISQHFRHPPRDMVIEQEFHARRWTSSPKRPKHI